MSKQDYFDSGDLELYTLGLTDVNDTGKINTLRLAQPDIHQELLNIELALEKLAKKQAVKPSLHLKKRIMSALDFAEERIELDNLPPTGKYSNYQRWFRAVEHLIPAGPFDDFFGYVLQQNEKIAQTLVVTKLDVPVEVHENVAESFFILRGTCTCKVGKEIFTLNAGDYLDIPLYTEHDIRIDSPYVVAILQHRFN